MRQGQPVSLKLFAVTVATAHAGAIHTVAVASSGSSRTTASRMRDAALSYATRARIGFSATVTQRVAGLPETARQGAASDASKAPFLSSRFSISSRLSARRSFGEPFTIVGTV